MDTQTGRIFELHEDFSSEGEGHLTKLREQHRMAEQALEPQRLLAARQAAITAAATELSDLLGRGLTGDEAGALDAAAEGHPVVPVSGKVAQRQRLG